MKSSCFHRYGLAAVCLALSLTGCNSLEEINPGGQDDDPAASFREQAVKLGIPIASWTDDPQGYLRTMSPGIILYEQFNERDKSYPLIGVSNDGGAFVIPDVSESNMTIQSGFRAFDGARTAYFFDRKVYDTYDTCHFKVMDEYATRDTMLRSSDAALSFHASSESTWQALATNTFYQGLYDRYTISKTGTATIIGIPVTEYTVFREWVSKHKTEAVERYYVDKEWRCLKKETAYGGSWLTLFQAVEYLEGGDFGQTYRTIALKHMKGTVVPVGDMIPQYTLHDDRWISEWYPRELDQRFLKYEGKGTVREMSVIRIPNWPPYDNVSAISVILTGVDRQDAESYISQVSDTTGINKVLDESSYDSGVYIEMCHDPSFPGYSQDIGSTDVGHSYKISWNSWPNGIMTIEFNITRM